MITIITTVKNDFRGLFLTIKSVIAQKNISLEYIIVDGKSSDYTTNVILDLIKNKPFIKYIRMRDKNLYHGINRGIKLANGNVIGLLNSGDIYFDDYILSKVERNFLKNKNLKILSGNLLFYNSDRISRVWKTPIYSKLSKWNIFRLAHPATFLKKDLFKNKLYDYLNYSISADTDFFLKIVPIKNKDFQYIDKFFIYMKDGGASTALKNTPRKIFEDLNILLKHFGLLFFPAYIKKISIKIPSFFSAKYNFFYKQLIEKVTLFSNN